MIHINSLNKSFGGQNIFKDASFIISKGEKLGLVGRNGSGKSTLLKIISGEESFDSGSVEIPKNYKIGFLKQHISFTEPNALEECIKVLPTEKKFEDFRVKKILSGLGFSDDDFFKSPNSFSGGYQLRIELCKVLVQSPDLLLLDEPTNYLDLPSVRWLKKFLGSFKSEVLIITHDRKFMDDVCNQIIGITRERIKKVKGSTSKYYDQLITEDEIYERTRLNQDKKRSEIESFVERFKAKASKAKQAQSRLKLLDKMGSFEKLAVEKSMGLNFRFKEIKSKYFAEIRNLSFGYEAIPLFSNLSFDIEKGDSIGIIGKNGRGKSTLLNLLGGILNPKNGNITYAKDVEIGHFGQTNVLNLNEDNTIIEEIENSNELLTSSESRAIAGSLLFEGDLAQKKIKVLSGGEKNRVLLGKIIGTPCNLLLLDEPTNHLDMESIEILKKEIAFFEGVSIVVTHSEDFLNGLVNKLIYFQNDNAYFFNGTYDDFLEKVGWEDTVNITKNSKSKLSRKDLKKLRAELIAQRSIETRHLKKIVNDLEKSIETNESLISSLEKKLLTATENGDQSDIFDITTKIGKLNEEIENLFIELEHSSTELDDINAIFEDKLSQLDDN